MTARPRVLSLVDLCTSLAEGRPSHADIPAVEISSIVIDSRRVAPGGLFVALAGERRDGHEFVTDALARGAVAVMVQRAPDAEGPWLVEAASLRVSKLGDAYCLIVSDCLAALQQAAAYWRRQHDVRVIGVTGSIGKTTSKEAIEAVLRTSYRTLKSEASYNNEIGLPLTLLNLTSAHERVILEMGMYAKGEIAQLAEIALPQVGLVTNVGPTHLERLGTIERIAEAKAELPQALPPQEKGGVAVLNYDDRRVRAMAGETRARVFSFGLDSHADLWADQIESRGLEGIRFRLHHGRNTVHARVFTLGRHSVHTALGAASVGLVEGLSVNEVVAGLRDQTEQLRLVAVAGMAGSTILDDTYNSSPASCTAALTLLDDLHGHKIAILGDMYELGRYEKEGHEIVGRRARDIVDVLVTVGGLARIIGDEALKAGMSPEAVYQVDTNSEAIRLAQAIVSEGDLVLVKGSRGMFMEEIVTVLTDTSFNGELPREVKS